MQRKLGVSGTLDHLKAAFTTVAGDTKGSINCATQLPPLLKEIGQAASSKQLRIATRDLGRQACFRDVVQIVVSLESSESASQDEDDDAVETKWQRIFWFYDLATGGRANYALPDLQTRSPSRVAGNWIVLPNWVIHPTSKFAVGWQMLMSVFLLYVLIIIPMEVSFGSDQEAGPVVRAFGSIVDVAFLFDMLVTFNLGFADDGTMITSKARIADRYFKSWFAIDFVSSAAFVFDIVGLSKLKALQSTRVLKIFRILKVLRVIKVTQAVSDDVDAEMRGFYKLIKLFIITMLTAHVCACVFYAVATGGEESWLKVRGRMPTHADALTLTHGCLAGLSRSRVPRAGE